MGDVATARYTGATPGADSSTYNLFSSVVAFPGAGMANDLGYKRIFITIDNPQSGTLKFYRSIDAGNGIARGTNWVQVGGDQAATSSATDVFTFDGAILGFQDFKVDWVNGGTAQTGWTVTISLDDGRAASV